MDIGLISSLRKALKQVDLRFKDPADELQYARSSQRYSFRLLALSCALGIPTLCGCFVLFTLPEMRRDDHPFTWSAQDPRFLASVALVVNISFLTLVSAVAMLGLLVQCGPSNLHEYCWLALGGMFALCLSMTRTYSAVRLAGPGVDSHSIWLHEPVALDGPIMLSLDNLVTVMCLCAVMRVHLLCVSILASVSFLVIHLFVFGVSESAALPATIVVMYALAVFAVVGAWRNERTDRREWLLGRKIIQQQSELESYSASAAGMTAIAEWLCDLV